VSVLIAMLTVGAASAQPSCDPTAVIGLSSALGVTLAAAAAVGLYAFKDRICCTRGDSQRVYDTPCPYCQKKQPRDCMREHLTECGEHRAYWTPTLTRHETPPLRMIQRPSRLMVRVGAPAKPQSIRVVAAAAAAAAPLDPSHENQAAPSR